MDQPTILAIEDWKRMGSNTESAVLIIAQTDLPGTAGDEEAREIEEKLYASGASDVFRAEALEEAAMLLSARQFALPALERQGRVFFEDVAVPRSKPSWVAAGNTPVVPDSEVAA